jgi:hypothetical protein
MPTFDWKSLLTQLNWKLIEHFRINEYSPGQLVQMDITPEVLAASWLGYPGATEEQIARAEVRLGKNLPPSYREFLKATNGWRLPGHFIPRLWSTEEIEWLATKDPQTVEVWNAEPSPPISDKQYFVYGRGQAEYNIRPEYLRTALQISAREYAGTAIYLLNPQVMSAHGEWEAWFLAHWLPGARRYRSFWEMMRQEVDASSEWRAPTL